MPLINLQNLRQQVSIRQVLDLMAYEPLSKCGDQWRGPCPVHSWKPPQSQSVPTQTDHYPSSQSRAFSVCLTKNVFQCFSCGSHGNQLDLWAAVHDLTIYQAAVDLSQRLGIDVSQ